jgi:2-polyprenyl-3-methyl-5-hydroxy-6-metoxy-1,4-benzoquinol methylase
MTNQLHYDYDFAEEDPRSTAAAVYSMVRDRQRILDLGSGPAVVSSRAAREREAKVVCVDSDADALLAAAERGVSDTIVADLQRDTWIEAVAGQKFDAVILADVLEHLYEPRDLLSAVLRADLLDEDGELVISFPNASHESVIGSLVIGDFEYQEKGILDATHIRWFTLKSMRRLLDSVGMTIDRVVRIERTIEQTSLDHVLVDLDDELRRSLRERVVDAGVYQYVLTARRSVSAAEPSSVEVARREHAVDKAAIARLQALLETANRQREEATATSAAHERRIRDLERLIRDERRRYAVEQHAAAETHQQLRRQLAKSRAASAKYKKASASHRQEAQRYRRMVSVLRRTGLYPLVRMARRVFGKIRGVTRRQNGPA